MSVLRIADYAGCEAALKNPHLRQSLYDAGSLLMEDVLVNLHGDAHRARRQVEGQLFRRSFFRDIESNVLPKTLQAVLDTVDNSGAIDLKWLSYRLMLHLSLIFAGIDRVNGTETESEHLTALLARLGQAATLGQYQGSDKAQLEQDVRAAIEEFDLAYYQPSKRRRTEAMTRDGHGTDESQAGNEDILALLLANQSSLGLSDAAMLREVGFFYLASAHTSVHSITHGIHEIFDFVRAQGLTAEALLNNPLLLQRCAHESLRLHPSSPEAWRRAECATSLPDGRKLAKGDEVVIDLQSANRDRAVFGEDANAFDPNRDRKAGINPWGLSLGSGMHVCIGLNLVAGTVPRDTSTSDLSGHQWGSLTVIYRLLLAAGIARDPSQLPQKDPASARDTWLRYPVVFHETSNA